MSMILAILGVAFKSIMEGLAGAIFREFLKADTIEYAPTVEPAIEAGGLLSGNDFDLDVDRFGL